ncbi:MAG: hypothetical protein V3V88_03640 [Dehalococcoidia bacterium]
MNWFKSLVLTSVLVLAACISIAPTPILIGDLVEQNNQVVALYTDCSEGANYVPTKEGCEPEVLEQQALSTMDLATTFISADIKQPQGYDIYLATAMIYFRIGERNTNEYTRAEQIARQFFETQKATSGRAIHTARFYWAALTAAHAAWQWNNDRFALNAERKTDLLLCLAEGRQAELDDGARRIRLLQYLEVIEAIIAAID